MFSYAQHIALLGTHTLLLAFTALFLPRSTLLITSLPQQQSSLDKPQHSFLVTITASPTWTLLWLCLGTSVCQAWWAGWMRFWNLQRADGKLVALRDAWANTLIASILFHAIVVLFGAPIASHVQQTYLLSLLISLLTIFAPSYSLSLPLFSPSLPTATTPWSSLFINQKFIAPFDRVLVYPVLATCLAAWVGAFPIPLDWDRPWQAWPLTPAYGALIGHIAGAWIAAAVNAILFFASKDREVQDPVVTAPVTIKKKRKKKRD